MKETQSKVIEIKEISLEIFKLLLQYIYTDHVDITQELELDLLMASNLYGLNRLKNMCESRLVKHISMETVVDLLQLSHKHNAEELKKICMDFC